MFALSIIFALGHIMQLHSLHGSLVKETEKEPK